MSPFTRMTKLTKPGIGDVWIHSWRVTGRVRSVCYHPFDGSQHWVLRGPGLALTEELFSAGNEGDLILRLRAIGARLEPAP